MEPAVMAATIVAVATFIGVLVTAYVTVRNTNSQLELQREQLRKQLELQREQLSKQLELQREQQRQQLEEFKQKVDSEITALQQEQLRDVLRMRLETYPKLWRTMLIYWQHWNYEEKELDGQWANQFLQKLYECNKESGVFFSQPVYDKFAKIRSELLDFRRQLTNGNELNTSQIKNRLNELWFGTYEPYEPGLSTVMKNDFGSYAQPAVSRPEPSLENRA